MFEQPFWQQNNSTVLYACAKTNYLCYLITVRMTMYRELRAVLIVSERFKDDDIYTKLRTSGVFDEVIVVNFFPGQAFLKNNPSASSQELQKSIVNHFDAIMYSLGYEIGEFFSVVLVTDKIDYEFDIYLNSKKVYYLFFEMGPGALRRREKRILVEGDYKPAFRDLILELRAFVGRSPYSITFYNHGNKDFYPALGKLRLIYYLNEEVKRISEADRDLIFKAYDYEWVAPPVKENGGYTLFSLQGGAYIVDPIQRDKSFVSLFMKNKDRFLIYKFVVQTVIDYFVDENDETFIKTHPNHPFTPKIAKVDFDSKIKLLSKMPGQFYELEPSIRQYTFEAVIDFGSVNMSLSYKQGYFLSRSFCECIPVINRLWFVLGLIYEHLKINELVGIFGVSSVHAKVLARKRFNREIECADIKNLSKHLSNPQSTKVVIIKDLDSTAVLEKTTNANIVAILRTKNAPNVQGYYTSKFVITKETLKKSGFSTLREEEFYILVKNEELSDEITTNLNEFSEIKELQMVGTRINCNAKR